MVGSSSTGDVKTSVLLPSGLSVDTATSQPDDLSQEVSEFICLLRLMVVILTIIEACLFWEVGTLLWCA